MRNIFLEISYTKFGGETIPRSFSKKKLDLSCQPLAFTSLKGFSKTKRGLDLVSLHLFLNDFWRKIFLLLYSITWSSFIVLLPLLRDILGNTCIVIVCKLGCDVIKFEISLLSNQTVFLTWPKIQDKNLNILITKDEIKSNFLSLKGLSLKQIKQLEGESPTLTHK